MEYLAQHCHDPVGFWFGIAVQAGLVFMALALIGVGIMLHNRKR